MRPAGYDYDTYSRLAGPLTQPSGTGYRVQYTKLLSREPRRIGAILLTTLAPVLTGALLVYLVWPTHWVRREGGEPWRNALDTTMLVVIGLIELFMVVNVMSIAHATLVARDPVPVLPAQGTRVAFLTTYVPGKEPLTTVRATLEAAVRLTHPAPSTSGCSTRATTSGPEPCAPSSASGTSPGSACPSGTHRREATRPVPNTATTTRGSPCTGTRTTSSPPSTPTMSRCPDSSSA